MCARSISTLRRLYFQGLRVYKELTENNPAHRPYLKHEEKELRTTLQMLENAIEEKQVEEIAVRRSTSSNSLSSRIKVIADNDVTSISTKFNIYESLWT